MVSEWDMIIIIIMHYFLKNKIRVRLSVKKKTKTWTVLYDKPNCCEKCSFHITLTFYIITIILFLFFFCFYMFYGNGLFDTCLFLCVKVMVVVHISRVALNCTWQSWNHYPRDKTCTYFKYNCCCFQLNFKFYFCYIR